MFASINRTKLVPLGMTGALALAIAASAGFSEDVVAKQAPDKTASAPRVWRKACRNSWGDMTQPFTARIVRRPAIQRRQHPPSPTGKAAPASFTTHI